MYGTIARLQLRPGMEAELKELANQELRRAIPGYIASYIYQMDADPNEYYMAVLFESKEAYFANAQHPEQDADYRRLRELLVADPEWHDGEVVIAEEI